jgi:hypothetical protein
MIPRLTKPFRQSELVASVLELKAASSATELCSWMRIGVRLSASIFS